ncbi:hypothetical protein JN531_003665 [Flagellatimonas centrodinii]|uniref:hypothetical protein n=1 Tax=Flagellatimonas centrodinii TaxID=2806210 RepID=UPI001FEDBE0A|nr:hypothetical protein [Flagellatimonas centrodinii]ULQ47384.1 hypothetical protein JN531_003665 [Flagellatimonas centrodinii]
MATATVKLRIRRGVAANLPASASVGELLLATDTGELWYGTGAGRRRIPHKQTRGYTVTTNGSGLATLTFPEAFVSPPVVQLTAVSEDDDRPNSAEIESVSATQVVIRSWRTGNGLAVNTERPMTVHVTAYGELA